MNRLFFVLLWVLPLWAGASELPSLDSAPVDVYDKTSLQRGARLYADYCQGCHSLKYVRYARLARDMDLTEAEVMDQFLHGTGNIGDTMSTAMTSENGLAWFGVAPPDLSLTARARGADWLYTYLRSFYLDPARPSGVNNLLFKDVAMPNVMGELQGQRERVELASGKRKTYELKQVQPGRMDEDEFDQAVGDLTNFLAYVAEPAQLERSHYGKYVLLFLIILLVILYKLKEEYWRDVD